MTSNSIVQLVWLLILPGFSIGQQFSYGTENLAALEHYKQGWEYILDKGEWTLAETSFRKSVALDPDFVLAWSQVGRISHDPKERAKIFQELSPKVNESNNPENLLLQVYLASLELIDLRDRGEQISKDKVAGFYQVSERNFKTFLKSFPHEPYIQAEYIEVIHGQYGPQASLDSISLLSNSGQLTPFLVSYKAQMFAELKEFDQAINTAEELELHFQDEDPPILAYTRAYIYLEKNSLHLALKEIKEVLHSDPNHVLAQRLKIKIDNRLEKKQVSNP
jgi:tetratricopeptide (TPR) repeat protein